MVNVFAGEIDKAKQGEIEFSKVVEKNCDIDLNIDANSVSDDELKEIKGNVNPIIIGIAVYIGTKLVDDAIEEATGKTVGKWIGYACKKVYNNIVKNAKKEGKIKNKNNGYIQNPALSGS